MESHCLSIFRNISLNIFVETTLVLRCHTCNCGNVFVEGLINTRAVRNISIIVQLENTRLDVLTIVLQCCQERRHRATSHILHRNVVIGNDLTIGIIIIDDLKVGFLFNRFQINQDKLSGVHLFPSAHLVDFTISTINHRRSSGVIDIIPHGRLVIPRRSSISRNFFPCNGICSFPISQRIITGSLAVCNRNLGNRIIFIILRSNNANVAASPVVEDRCGFGIHVFLDWGNRAVRVDNCNRQCDLTLAAGSILRSTVRAISPVLDVGFNFFRDFRLLQIIGDRLIRAEEIMPSAVHCLILPRTGVITDMRKGRAIGSLVIARIIRLFVVCIQPHCLPVIHVFPTIEIGIGMFRCKLCNVNAFIGVHAISRSGNALCVIRRSRSRVINRRVRNPVLQRQRSIRHRAVRSLVLDNDRIQHITDHNLRRARLLTGEGDGGLLACRLYVVQVQICLSICCSIA